MTDDLFTTMGVVKRQFERRAKPVPLVSPCCRGRVQLRSYRLLCLECGKSYRELTELVREDAP